MYHNTFFLQAGIIEEMLEDTMDMEDDELEDEAEEEVEKVLWELTAGHYTIFLTYLHILCQNQQLYTYIHF